MRSVIIGLSVIFFVLSTIALYKGLNSSLEKSLVDGISINELPLKKEPSHQENESTINNKTTEEPKAIDTIVNLPDHDVSQKNIIASTPAVPAPTPAQHIEKKDSDQENKINPEDNKRKNVDPQYRILAVFGGKTFRSGKDHISDIAALKFEKLISELSLFTNASISIEGHTDSVPTGKSSINNIDLSIRRARVIANHLIERGINRDRISVIGHGDTQPVDSNDTEEGRAKNRRVEIKLMLKEQEDN